MGADNRVTYRKNSSLNTRSNYFRKVRTPGSRIVIQYLKKSQVKNRSLPKCGDTGVPLRGVYPNRGNYNNRRLTTAQKKRQNVKRSYGGTLSGAAVRTRILRAFLIEEARILKKVQRRRRAQREGYKIRRKPRGQAWIKLVREQEEKALVRKEAEAKAAKRRAAKQGN